MKKMASLLLWLLAFMLTVLLAVYQRLSGPTYPVRGRVDAPAMRYEFFRSWTSHQPLPVRVTLGGGDVELRLHYRRYPFIAGECWKITTMKAGRSHSREAFIPGQPAAGKVAYKVEALGAGGGFWINRGRFVVARFKNGVPTWLLIAHVLFMFAGMLLAFRAGLAALRQEENWPRLTAWTLGATGVGGLVLGPIVQKFAFGAFWTGFPLGGDLTDSKTLFVVLFWLAAHLLRKKGRRWTVAATLLMVAVYMIPHSVLGSELDYKTGKVRTATANLSDK